MYWALTDTIKCICNYISAHSFCRKSTQVRERAYTHDLEFVCKDAVASTCDWILLVKSACGHSLWSWKITFSRQEGHWSLLGDHCTRVLVIHIALAWVSSWPAAPRLCCAVRIPGLQENPRQLMAFTQLPHGTSNCFNCMALPCSKSPERSCHVINLFGESCYLVRQSHNSLNDQEGTLQDTTEGICAASCGKIHLVSIWCCTNVRWPTSGSDLLRFYSLLYVIRPSH